MDKYEVLNKYYNYSSFRDVQENIIDSLIKRIDTIAILKTGGGKSICFQIPAILADGITLVITPLISLMYDQVRELHSKGIRADYINSSKENISFDDNKIIYISPERLSNKNFINEIIKYKISYIIVDEAHTILWHMDFRESFLAIKDFIRMFDYNICIGLFSATANKYTLQEMKRVIGIYNFNIIKSSFDRPELSYIVERNKNKLDYIKNYLNGHYSSGIIYCQTRKNVIELYNHLKNDYNVIYYHGGLDPKLKEKNQDIFIKNDDVIMITTISFGMGINKSNIRFVINYNIPDSLESLSQMSGRCSRDGKFGECIILYNDIDTRVIYYFIREIDATNKSIKEINNIKKYKYICLNSLIKVLKGSECIHKAMSLYFGEKINKCKTMCSVCLNDVDKKN